MVVEGVVDTCALISVWVIDQFGEPSGKFVFAISMLYLVMMGLVLFWI